MLHFLSMSWKLVKNAERRLQGEIALLRPASGGDVRVALGYPNSYYVGMSNLGMQIVYGILNRTPGVCCERFFLPDPEELEEYELCGRRLFTLESQRPIGEFDIVAFTVAYEHDYVNFVRLLDLAGIPLFSADRSEAHPLVLVGGAVTFLNPEPIADFVDVFCIGEGEGMTEPLVEQFRATAGRPRRERLETLASIPGLYVPSLSRPHYEGERFQGLDPPMTVQKNYLSREAFAAQDTASLLLTDDTEFGRSFLIEVSRGCPYVCRFCTVGFSYPKVRWKPVDQVWESIDRVRGFHPKVGLISATVGNHPQIEELCHRLMEHDLQVSFSSLRADQLPDAILETLVKGGSKTLTLAPETGSEDLRRSINKRFSDERYFESAERAFLKGVRNLRMYSMVGLPNELESDMDALIDLVRKTRALQRRTGQGAGRITLSLGLFVTKPLTPYQWNEMASIELAQRRMKKVQKALASDGGVKVNSESPRWAVLEGLLARADRRMARVLARVYRNPTFRVWLKALEAEGLSLESQVYRRREPDETLPWSHIASSWPKDRLLKDGERARNQRFGSRNVPA
ncbi:MAG: radical SAM protein [Armatimonadetes bacterium]|nr:radical SAM protein [Armatimonadota bacterium]